MLQQIRALCKFWRNAHYRLHVSRLLKRRVAGVEKLLRFFTASFAKWRYETIADVLKQLVKFRDICENKLNVAMFSNAQDPEFIRAVFEACADKQLWRWIAAAEKFIFGPLEALRRWGMVCDCEDHVAERIAGKKHIDCGRILRFSFTMVSFQCFSEVPFQGSSQKSIFRSTQESLAGLIQHIFAMLSIVITGAVVA